ncbi:glycerol-3-phosphate 1-O-acyltransferase PlsY [Parvibaculum sp.]|jgi:acyl phosphate:glycerol-3-phosphate acyltransferase|uniref:glycerol-3-phosphate 1-O-acyltransferase PlsY n=1 Tax=Parvibaculum sp. TaxID=2024848 RepID=UPI000C5F1EA3|nr:glycerol-3-phosphate 1-O-acyltransferase PlsY [Parvibaculum sp.]MAM93857.1 glycerol-3-phosphate acyltransferase [Parvibaculum sp.]|tara:strand:+ start:180 stop:845 length:666 start_codon:yes stop_codon:yes gene_type:complete
MPAEIDFIAATPLLLVALALGYLLGSIPFGLLLTRLAGLGDIRSIGSGNIGATNALRTGNRWVAVGTLIGDAGKGALAVYIAGLLAMQASPDSVNLTWMLGVAALGAFVGHLYPVWLGFKGGKGVSTFIGILLALYWPVGLLFCATWIIVALTSRYSSLSALVAALLTPVYLAWLNQWDLIGLSVILVALIYIAHRDNIRRLLAGEESRIGQKKAEDKTGG